MAIGVLLVVSVAVLADAAPAGPIAAGKRGCVRRECCSRSRCHTGVDHYNERRTHSALGNRTPLARVRDVTGLDS
jgi:hypothetical protein